MKKYNVVLLILLALPFVNCSRSIQGNNETFIHKETEFANVFPKVKILNHYTERVKKRGYFVNAEGELNNEPLFTAESLFGKVYNLQNWPQIHHQLKKYVDNCPKRNSFLQAIVCSFVNEYLLELPQNQEVTKNLIYYLDFLKAQENPDWELWLASLYFLDGRINKSQLSDYQQYTIKFTQLEINRLKIFLADFKQNASKTDPNDPQAHYFEGNAWHISQKIKTTETIMTMVEKRF